MYDKRNFQHDGKEYEIRVASDGKTIHVRAFFNGKPANGYTYSVEVLTQVSENESGVLTERLIETAISDVKNGIWEQYSAAVSAACNQSA